MPFENRHPSYEFPAVSIPPSTLFVIGPPGSGKKTYASNFRKISTGTPLSSIDIVQIEDFEDRFTKEEVFGVVLLFDATKPNIRSELALYLPFAFSVFGKTNILTHATKADLCPSPSLALLPFHELFSLGGVRLPIFNLDPRREGDVYSSSLAILSLSLY